MKRTSAPLPDPIQAKDKDADLEWLERQDDAGSVYRPFEMYLSYMSMMGVTIRPGCQGWIENTAQEVFRGTILGIASLPREGLPALILEEFVVGNRAQGISDGPIPAGIYEADPRYFPVGERQALALIRVPIYRPNVSFIVLPGHSIRLRFYNMGRYPVTVCAGFLGRIIENDRPPSCLALR